MTPKEFARYLNRDGEKCLHCGTTEGLVPQHRKNRGMGGSKARNVPSNIIVLCSAFNGRIEADADAAILATERGWKLASWEDAEFCAVYDVTAQGWFMLDNSYRRWAV